jgi:hypothetical protein
LAGRPVIQLELAMKATTAIAAALGLAFAVAATSSAFAADPRGSTPSKPTRVSAVPPPPPPPGGPDKYTTQTRPPGPDGSQHARPKPIDDFGATPRYVELKPRGRTYCYADEDCKKFVENCHANGGGASIEPNTGGTTGTTVCTYYHY